MTKSIAKLNLIGLLAVTLAALPASSVAKESNTNAPAVEKKAPKESKAAKKSSKLPFHGNLKAVDKTAKTISVGEMTLQVTSETIISKGDKPATLEDGVVGARGHFLSASMLRPVASALAGLSSELDAGNHRANTRDSSPGLRRLVRCAHHRR